MTIGKNSFSLIEVIVVLSIILIISIITIPAWRQISGNLELNSEARAIASSLRKAQQFSVTEQINYLVFFDIAQNKYQLKKILNLDQPDVETLVETNNLESPVQFQQVTGLTNNKVRFNSVGAASDTGEVIIVDSRSKTKTIKIKPSGYIEL